MKISLNWLKSFIKINKSPEEIESLLTNVGLEVDEVITLSSDNDLLKKLRVGQIKEIKKHPEADRLSITTVDLEDKISSIICGAKNIEVGQKVVVAIPGTTIKTIEGKYADLFYSDEVSELINEDKIIISDLTAKLYSINIGDILVLVGMNEETTELEVGDIIDFDNSNMFPETPMGFNNASWTSLNFVILEMKRAVGKVSVKARSV